MNKTLGSNRANRDAGLRSMFCEPARHCWPLRTSREVFMKQEKWISSELLLSIGWAFLYEQKTALPERLSFKVTPKESASTMMIAAFWNLCRTKLHRSSNENAPKKDSAKAKSDI